MADEFLGDRRKALEEAFFARANARLVEQLKSSAKQQEIADALAGITGITDVEMLEKFAALDIGPNTWAALSLVPMVEVAWANGKVEPQERHAVLSAAEANGITPGSAAHELLESWLSRRPDGRLLALWGEYIVVLCARLSAADKEALRSKIIGRARDVARAAGGFLGLGAKISAEEKVVLDQLEKAFD